MDNGDFMRASPPFCQLCLHDATLLATPAHNHHHHHSPMSPSVFYARVADCHSDEVSDEVDLSSKSLNYADFPLENAPQGSLIAWWTAPLPHSRPQLETPSGSGEETVHAADRF